MKNKFLMSCAVGFFSLAITATSYAQVAGGVSTAPAFPNQPVPPAPAAPGAPAGDLAKNASVQAGAPPAVPGKDNATPAGEAQKPPRSRALHWDNDNGYDMLRDLLVDRSNSARQLSIQQKANRANSLARPPRNKTWLNYFLRSDRERITSGVWKFVTTPNDRYYYRPWAPVMRSRNPARVIGFNTWQDAMVAGYRPDPDSWPDPAPQLLYLSTMTHSLELAHYVEFTYAGQITPQIFNANFKYMRYVENLANQRPDTRKEKSETIAHIIGAALGYNDLPKKIGGAAWIKQEQERRVEEQRRLREEEEERERLASQRSYSRVSRIIAGAIVGAILGAILAGD